MGHPLLNKIQNTGACVFVLSEIINLMLDNELDFKDCNTLSSDMLKHKNSMNVLIVVTHEKSPNVHIIKLHSHCKIQKQLLPNSKLTVCVHDKENCSEVSTCEVYSCLVMSTFCLRFVNFFASSIFLHLLFMLGSVQQPLILILKAQAGF